MFSLEKLYRSLYSLVLRFVVISPLGTWSLVLDRPTYQILVFTMPGSPRKVCKSLVHSLGRVCLPNPSLLLCLAASEMFVSP